MNNKVQGNKGGNAGRPSKISATPQDNFKDQNKDHLPGGVLESQISDGSHGRLSPDISNDDKDYKKQTLEGMSQVKRDAAEDITTDKELSSNNGITAEDNPDSVPYTINKQNASGDDSPGSDAINTESAPFSFPDNKGEQSISGSTPDPTSDDDTLEVAHAVGTQLGETDAMEHPQEVDIARDVDQAEESLRTH